MQAWLTARRVKKGQEEEFRKQWKGGDMPDGMLDAYLLEDEENPRETLSISFWDTARELLQYRTSEESQKRKDNLSDVVDKEHWSRAFVAFNADDIDTGGGKKKLLMLPLLLIAAGAGIFYFLKRRGQNGDDEWDTWEPEPASTFQPTQAPVTATAAAASPMTPPPAVRPLDAESRNGGQQERASSTQGSSTTAAARPAMSEVHAPARASTPSAPRAASAPSSTGSATRSEGRSGQRPRTVRDLMTANPETVDVSTDVVAAARLMHTLDVGVLPVMADGRLAGMVTDRDIALGVAQRGTDPASVSTGDVMTEAPTTISADASVDDAARLMSERQIRRLPVVEDGTRLVGIIALGDLAAEGAQKAAGGALEDISEPASPSQ